MQRWVDAGRLQAWKTPGGHRRIEADGADRLFSQQLTEGRRPRKRPVVFVVEDNADDRDLMEVALEQQLPGAEVRSFDNPIPALVAIGQVVPDVLVSDVVMPHMDGLEMLRQLAGPCVAQPALIIVVSSLSDQELARMGGLPEGVARLHKPISADELGQALQPLAARKR